MNPLLARGRDRLETTYRVEQSIDGKHPLLARGRDRLETLFGISRDKPNKLHPLLARGRDRLETGQR